jgi:hypothetical protein
LAWISLCGIDTRMTLLQKEALENYKLKPLILNAEQALENGQIKFADNGTVDLQIQDQSISITPV